MVTGVLEATPAAPTLMTDEDAAAVVAGAAAGSGGTRGHLSVLRTMLEADGAPDAPRPVSEGLPLTEAQVASPAARCAAGQTRPAARCVTQPRTLGRRLA